MSQPAMSAAVAGEPRPYRSAAPTIPAAPNSRYPVSAAMRTTSRDMIGHGPAAIDAPRLDGVVVIEGIRAAGADHRIVLRLYISRLVDGAALQQRRPAIPPPGHSEAGERLRQDRLLK